MEQIKNQEKQHNTPIQVGYRSIFQPETQICKNQKTKTNNSNNNKTPKLLFPVWCSLFPFYTHTRVSMRAQEIQEYHQHIHSARKRQCGNKAQTNPANLEYVPLTTVTLVISSRSFKNCKEEHMVNKTAWQRRIHLSVSLWSPANTWQDEAPWDACSDGSPLLHSVLSWLSRALPGAGCYRDTSLSWQEWTVRAAQPLGTTCPVAAFIGTGNVPNPQPFMHPCFHQQCSLSSSQHVPTWAGLPTKLSPALLDSTKHVFISLRALQELQVSTQHSQSPLLGPPLGPDHTTETPLLLHWMSQQLLYSHWNSNSQPKAFKLIFPISQNDAAIPSLPALHLSSCQSLAVFKGRVQVSLNE